MRIHNFWFLAGAVVIVFALAGALCASETAATTITVADMHCKGCAKKIVKKLTGLSGVDKVESNVEAKTVKILPKAETVLSPRLLWETVEKAGKQPTKLQGPSGTFTDKPQS